MLDRYSSKAIINNGNQSYNLNNGNGKAKTNLGLPEHSSEVILLKLTLIFLHTYEIRVYETAKENRERKNEMFNEDFFQQLNTKTKE